MKTATGWSGLILSLALSSAIAQAEQAKPATSPMDLRVAKVTELFTAEELRVAMRLDEPVATELVADDAQLDTVVVEGASDKAAVSSPNRPPSGLAAVLWSVAHPLQAWRIFVPSPSE